MIAENILRSAAPIVAAVTTGCVTPQTVHHDRIEDRMDDAEPSAREARAALADVQPGKRPLDRQRLVRAVLDRNPSLEAARAATRAALARYEAEDAMPDPVLSYSFAPGSIFDPDVHYGQTIQLSQKLPWPGKLSGRGDVELYRAEMLAEDYQTARLELALRACRLYDRYYAVTRALEINAEHRELVEQIKGAIEAQYATGKGSLYRPVQARVTLTQLERERHSLEAEHEVIVAQLNALLHRPPDARLAPPPKRLSASDRAVESARTLEKQALAARPELRSIEAQQKGLEASIDVAQREYAPDFTIFGSYSSMWQSLAHQFMVGVSAPIPIVVARRAGGERSARESLSASRSKNEALRDEIRAEVHEARARVKEATDIVRLYEDELLPLAKQQAEAVRPAFATGDANLYEVLAAQRELWTIEQSYHEALAELHTRLAELDRALGRIPGLGKRGAR